MYDQDNEIKDPNLDFLVNVWKVFRFIQLRLWSEDNFFGMFCAEDISKRGDILKIALNNRDKWSLINLYESCSPIVVETIEKLSKDPCFEGEKKSDKSAHLIDMLLTTHWLTYLADYQIKTEIVWGKLFPILFHLVYHLKKLNRKECEKGKYSMKKKMKNEEDIINCIFKNLRECKQYVKNKGEKSIEYNESWEHNNEKRDIVREIARLILNCKITDKTSECKINCEYRLNYKDDENKDNVKDQSKECTFKHRFQKKSFSKNDKLASHPIKIRFQLSKIPCRKVRRKTQKYRGNKR